MMKVFRSPFEAGKWAPGSVVAIGKFDGMHLGHQKLLKLALRRAKALSAKCLVVTFDPSPQQFFAPGSYRPLLSLERKLELIGELGVDGTLLLAFDSQLSCLAPEAFARDIVSTALKAVDVFVGANFCFGKDRAGRIDDLSAYGRAYGFLVHAIPLLKVRGRKVDSSTIRSLLEAGQKAQAERLLGRSL